MQDARPEVCLGFTEERFPPGLHICQVFSDDDERQDVLLSFIRSGLQSRERTSCFSDRADTTGIARHLAQHEISCDHAISSGSLTVAPTREIYFEGGAFDPDRMLRMLATYHDDAIRDGHRSARVIGEMAPDVLHMEGGNRLFEYESRVSILLRDRPLTAVCQYDARSFDGAMIMDVLKVHPLMIIRGAVVRNPFYIPPEEFLGL